MRLDSEKISQIQTVIVNDDECVEFTEDEFDKGLWYISNSRIHRFGAKDKEGESDIEETFSNSVTDTSYSEFYKQIEGKELKARIFLGRSVGEEKYQVYEDWETLAKTLGISELVTLATKVPKTVAKRFAMFANQKGDRSSVLRKLVYDYVKNQMVEQAETLMFKEEI